MVTCDFYYLLDCDVILLLLVFLLCSTLLLFFLICEKCCINKYILLAFFTGFFQHSNQKHTSQKGRKSCNKCAK